MSVGLKRRNLSRVDIDKTLGATTYRQDCESEMCMEIHCIGFYFEREESPFRTR